jgi:hypothetical protein
MLEGRASLSVDAMTSGKTERGTLELSLSNASVANLNGISGQLSAKLDGHHLSGSSTGRVQSLGGFSADFDSELAGPANERASYEGATGNATLALNGVTLEYLGQLVPEADIDVDGEATLSLKLSRHQKDAVPDAEFTGTTQGLSVSLARKDQPPLVFSGIELEASATHDGATGNTSASLSALSGSERLVAASGEMTLDLRAALAKKEPILRQLEARPLSAKLVVNQAKLDALPGPLRVPLRGGVRLEATVRGSYEEPIGSLSVRATDLQLSSSDRGEPVDVCGTAEYAKASGAFNVGAEVFLPSALDLRRLPCSGKRVANVQLSGAAPLAHPPGTPAWTGTALATLEGLPISTVPALADARVTGTASGSLLLDRSGALPVASAELALDGVKMDRLEVGSGTITVRSSGARARAQFAVKRGAAAIDGELNAGITWASELPAIDDAEPVDASVTATRLEASLLGPFLTDFVNELRGTVDGAVSARLSALAKGETVRKVENVQGQLTLRDGSFVLTGLGFRLRDVGFNATAKNEGPNTLVEIRDLLASAGARSQNLRARADLHLQGFSILSGEAGLTIVALPLVVDGITRANANAEATLTIQRKPEKMFAEVSFRSLDAQLPKESSRELTELNENENVTILQPIAEPRGGRTQADLPWHFLIHLGDRARVARGVLLDLPLAGDPNVVLARDLGVTGSISLRQGGSVQMLGKIFLIEGGGVFFDTADPKDPRLDVRASWRTPEGDTLFVYVTGTVSKPRLKFDRSDAEAWALLLGGGSDANLGVSALDTLLADTPLAKVQLRATSDDQSSGPATYTAAYRANDSFVVEGNYQESRGTASSDTSGTGNATGNVSAAVEYRFRGPLANQDGPKNWSVRTEVGTIGAGVDLLYQYRY